MRIENRPAIYEEAQGVFRDSDKATALYRDLQAELQDLQFPRAIERKVRKFSRIVFGNIAFEYLRRSSEWARVLSRDDTYKFYSEELYPDRQRIKGSFGIDRLSGIAVPKGLILFEEHEKKVDWVCEYLLGDEDELETYVAKTVVNIGKDKEKFPNNFSDAKLLFILPLNTSLPPESSVPGDVHFMYIPISRSRFGLYINQVLDSHQFQASRSAKENDVDNKQLAEKDFVFESSYFRHV